MQPWRTRWKGQHPPSGAALPDMTHVSHFEFEHVYEPSDDTYLFVDVIRGIRGFLVEEFFDSTKAYFCVELGSGSGMLSAAWMNEYMEFCCYMLSVDCNPSACAVTSSTMKKNGVASFSDCINGDLLSSFADDSVDVLMFNPPYVTTPSEEVGLHGIAAAWAGGRHGREVTDRLFPQLKRCMKQKSVILLLASEENIPDQISRILEEELSYVTYCVSPRRCMNERLMIILAVRK